MTLGGVNPSSKSVSVTNSGGGTLSGLQTSITYAKGSGWLSASLDTTTAPATLTVQPTTGSLAAGTYDATISVSSSVADNSPQQLSVTFSVVSDLPDLVVSGLSLSLPPEPVIAMQMNTITLTLTAVVQNVGGTVAAASTLMCQLVLIPNSLLFSVVEIPPREANVPELAPGASFTVSLQMSFQLLISTGAAFDLTGQASAIADYYNVVAESNENNNTRTESFSFLITPVSY